jgi:hypothetical protein
MIIGIGSQNAVSFTDDTSLDTRLTDNRKVSVHAQVLRECRLDWFYTLIRDFPQIKGELKSASLIDNYFSLPQAIRRQIQSTLRQVRVHITDPRPYIADVKTALSDILTDQNPDEFLRRLETEQNEIADSLRRKLTRFVARKMFLDSPSQRLKRKYRICHDFYSLRLMPDYIDESLKDSDFTYFEDNKSRIQINKLSVFTSKSASVFSPAMDTMDELLENPYQVMSPIGAWKLNRELCLPHAFDAGNDKAIEWIDGRRHEVLAMSDKDHWFRQLQLQAPLESIDSKDSFFVQAADIAAGLAKAICERKSLVELVRLFDYVTYNGQRLSEDAAIDIHRKKVP